jgi:serine protease Do
LTPELRQQIEASDSVHGAVIEQVTPGSAADNAGLQPGDVITEVNRTPVHSAADVKSALSNIKQGDDAMVLVWSRGGTSFRVLHATQG